MNEIRTQDLRFTSEEAATLLNSVMDIELPMEEVIRLEAKTEGWVSGLLMAAISMRDMRDVSGFIKTFEGSHRFIFDYLVEEVLDGLPVEIQDFLLQTSILDRLCAPLCDAILGRGKSQSIIQQLEGLNLFIFPLDDRRYWYRYHQLFSDLLINRLTELSPEMVTGLHRRASVWYEANDLLAEAVAHAFSAGDVKRVAHIAQANVLGIMDRGELGMLIHWLDDLPGEVIDDYPWLKIAQVWAQTQAGSFDAAERCLSSVEVALQPDSSISKDQKSHIFGHIAAIRFYIEFIYLGDYSRAAELANNALELLPQTDLRTRGMVTVLLGNMQRIQQELDLAMVTLSSALEINRISGQAYVVIDILSQMARVRRDQGLLHDTVRLCQEAQDVADQFARGGQHRLPVVAYAMGTLGRVYYEWNQLDAALEIGLQALELSERWGQANTLMGNLLFVTRIYRVRGQFEQALATIQAAKGIGGGFSDARAAVIGTHEMLIRLAMGDIHPVERWVKCDSATFETDRDELLLEMAPLILALYRAGKVDSIDGLLAALNRMSLNFGDKGIYRRFASVNIQKAVVYQALGKSDQALAALKRALEITRSEGYIRVYLDHGAPMEDLLKKAITAGIQVNDTNRLLSTLQLELDGEKLHQDGQPAPLVEPLTNRETEVLRLLITDLTIPEIADELVITTGTLRTHIKRIYSKLNAHSRFEAKIQARKSGLL
jgi:LuxR family maltose regulon positive regulatory protein